jgi:hypothetical protein
MTDLAKEKLKFTLDLDKLDQSRIYTSKKGSRLLEFECVATPGGQYGQTHFITQRATKEERLAKTRLPILGNLGLAFPPKTDAPPASYQGEAPPPRALPPRLPPTEAQMANQTGGNSDVPF